MTQAKIARAITKGVFHHQSWRSLGNKKSFFGKYVVEEIDQNYSLKQVSGYRFSLVAIESPGEITLEEESP